MAKDYISRLVVEDKIGALEDAFENEFSLCPKLKAVVYRVPDGKSINIVLADRGLNFIKAYKATEFNCSPISKDLLPDEFREVPRSRMSCDDGDVRKFYLRFMKKTFDTYAADYKANLNRQAEYDLAETTL